MYIKGKRDREERRMKEIFEQARRERLAKSMSRKEDLTVDQKCVVCMDNPKEVSADLHH